MTDPCGQRSHTVTDVDPPDVTPEVADRVREIAAARVTNAAELRVVLAMLGLDRRSGPQRDSEAR